MSETSPVYGTLRRGKVKIRSKKQIRYLEFKGIPYTRITKSGKKVRRNVKKDPKRRRKYGIRW